MIICFKCPPDIKIELDRLMSSGQYSDYSEAITLALQNLVVMQEEMDTRDSMVIDNENDTPPTKRDDLEHAVPGSSLARMTRAQKHGRLPSSAPRETTGVPLPSLFAIGRFEAADQEKLPSPTMSLSPGAPIRVKDWIFGMYNRLLPVKASCRALANIISSESKHGIPVTGGALEKTAMKIAAAAEQLGRRLREHDQRYALKRDDALAIAFPSKDDESAKSLNRYANQFVGRLDKEDNPVGILFDLGLVGLTDTNVPLLQLTEAGWRFAALPNSIMDGTQKDPTEKLSGAEIEFLQQHILRNVPSESAAYKMVAEAIREGHNTPKKLDAALQQKESVLGEGMEGGAPLSTQRSGAIARMTDLGLVKRIRNGQQIRYRLTHNGTAFLDKTTTHTSEGRRDK